MKTLYLDMNIYNRPFDDQSQIRIKLETVAVFAIFQMIKTEKLKLIWSFILDYENSLNPYDDIRLEIEAISFLASEHIMTSEVIRTMAKTYEPHGIKPRDALHLACAVKSGSEYFITCDDQIVKKYPTLGLSIKIMNPIQFVLETEEKGYGTYDGYSVKKKSL